MRDSGGLLARVEEWMDPEMVSSGRRVKLGSLATPQHQLHRIHESNQNDSVSETYRLEGCMDAPSSHFGNEGAGKVGIHED